MMRIEKVQLGRYGWPSLVVAENRLTKSKSEAKLTKFSKNQPTHDGQQKKLGQSVFSNLRRTN
jgi:hypothetical protein